MPLPPGLVYHAARSFAGGPGRRGQVVAKRGEEILVGPYPKSLDQFIGQERARLQLIAAMTSAKKRQEPMDHILLASGVAGIGKTTLAKLVAFHLNVGIVELSGVISESDVQGALRVMADGDILFLDEIHRMIHRGKAKAEWLLHLLQDGVLILPTGVVKAPRITVIGATTDAQKLPETITSRFATKPILDAYTPGEAFEIAKGAAVRLGFGGQHIPMPDQQAWLHQVVAASNCNPRSITMLLTTVRDVVLATNPDAVADESGYDISLALKWTGVTEDGLNQVAQDYLLVLLMLSGHAGLATIKAALNEEQLGHTEKMLIQRGYLMINARGRELTEPGYDRAEALQAVRGET